MRPGGWIAVCGGCGEGRFVGEGEKWRSVRGMKQVAEEPESWEELEALKLGEEAEKGKGEAIDVNEEEQAQ